MTGDVSRDRSDLLFLSMVLHEASANAGDGTSPNTCALATLKKTPRCTQHCLYVYVIYIYTYILQIGAGSVWEISNISSGSFLGSEVVIFAK